MLGESPKSDQPNRCLSYKFPQVLRKLKRKLKNIYFFEFIYNMLKRILFLDYFERKLSQDSLKAEVYSEFKKTKKEMFRKSMLISFSVFNFYNIFIRTRLSVFLLLNLAAPAIGYASFKYHFYDTVVENFIE